MALKPSIAKVLALAAALSAHSLSAQPLVRHSSLRFDILSRVSAPAISSRSHMSSKETPAPEIFDLISDEDVQSNSSSDTSPAKKRQRPNISTNKQDMRPLWRLSTVSGISPEYNEGCVSFGQLMSGPWSSVTLFNYTWEFEWMVLECPRLLSDHSVTFVTGDNVSAGALRDAVASHENMKVLRISLPPYGKAVLIVYPTVG